MKRVTSVVEQGNAKANQDPLVTPKESYGATDRLFLAEHAVDSLPLEREEDGRLDLEVVERRNERSVCRMKRKRPPRSSLDDSSLR